MQDKTMQIAGHTVRLYSRLSIKLSIEAARTYNAVKLEESVDKEKIKALYQQGTPIQGVSEIHYIQVTLPKT